MIVSVFWLTKRHSAPQRSCVEDVREALSLGARGPSCENEG
jgi:hypothetical protein